MAAEFITAWRPSAIAASHAALLVLLDGAATAAKVTFHDSADTLLGTVPLTDPAGTIDGATGALTLTPDGRDESADAGGTPAYATIRDGDGLAYRSLPCQAGSFAVPGVCVINTMNIIAGGPLEIVALTIL